MLLIAAIDEECYPDRAHFTDAGLDLKAAKEVLIEAGQTEKVSTGIRVEIPPGHVGFIFPRSGLSSNKGLVLANTVGVIDADYRGEVICLMKNTGSFQYTIRQYERIAQLVIVPCMIGDYFPITMDELSDTDRGEGGFGHTGG
jgi:dUTP pyrophosphatase